ncbi:hypothetical protein Pla110_38830 [Polystyrenella longa]|uniref:Uncharacterized protein n=1 Tax=Polystyrenella longa TaxID=2528007 RepID=A0A518CSD2_9PLAN|nr:hypothetical protein [Polystyrenella longa]QDU82128.1 hypothetical protein Pla110_38830 [Polystyrenella longa]
MANDEKEIPIPPELKKLIESREGVDRRKKQVHVMRERRSGKDRRDDLPDEQK